MDVTAFLKDHGQILKIRMELKSNDGSPDLIAGLHRHRELRIGLKGARCSTGHLLLGEWQASIDWVRQLYRVLEHTRELVPHTKQAILPSANDVVALAVERVDVAAVPDAHLGIDREVVLLARLRPEHHLAVPQGSRYPELALYRNGQKLIRLFILQ